AGTRSSTRGPFTTVLDVRTADSRDTARLPSARATPNPEPFASARTSLFRGAVGFGGAEEGDAEREADGVHEADLGAHDPVEERLDRGRQLEEEGGVGLLAGLLRGLAELAHREDGGEHAHRVVRELVQLQPAFAQLPAELAARVSAEVVVGDVV